MNQQVSVSIECQITDTLNLYPFIILILIAMPLTLPSDDESGPLIPASPKAKSRTRRNRPGSSAGTQGQKATKAKATKKITNPTKKITVPSECQSVQLPADDDGPSLDFGNFDAVSSETTDTNQVLQYDDETLKQAAANIPSQLDHAFDDLRSQLENLQAIDKSIQCTLWEIFSVPRLQAIMQNMGGTCRRSYDLRHYADLGDKDLQRLVLQDVGILQTLALFLSPPCTWVSLLQHSDWGKVAQNKRILSLFQACQLTDFAMHLAKHQVRSNYLFGFEHPQGSLAWNRASVSQLTY